MFASSAASASSSSLSHAIPCPNPASSSFPATCPSVPLLMAPPTLSFSGAPAAAANADAGVLGPDPDSGSFVTLKPRGAGADAASLSPPGDAGPAGSLPPPLTAPSLPSEGALEAGYVGRFAPLTSSTAIAPSSALAAPLLPRRPSSRPGTAPILALPRRSDRVPEPLRGSLGLARASERAVLPESSVRRAAAAAGVTDPGLTTLRRKHTVFWTQVVKWYLRTVAAEAVHRMPSLV